MKDINTFTMLSLTLLEKVTFIGKTYRSNFMDSVDFSVRCFTVLDFFAVW